jgi:hypothetical protein
LLALLARRLTAEEVAAVAAQLRDDGSLPVTNTDIGELIMGSPTSCRGARTWRESARSWPGGWPLADPHSALDPPGGL